MKYLLLGICTLCFLFSCNQQKNTPGDNTYHIHTENSMQFPSEKIVDPTNTIFSPGQGNPNQEQKSFGTKDFEREYIFKNDNHPIANYHISCDDWLDNAGVLRSIQRLPNGESLHFIFHNCENQKFPDFLRNALLERESFVIDFGNFYFSEADDFGFLARLPAYDIIASGKLSKKNSSNPSKCSL
ncbi:hypothetical protein CSB09_00095 [Candidatus Gracilibacteria bacterium]|nr:MAG: hypothetical protein CSB09_00095 [Candidatus Gracilibacteria bacterium]